MTAKDLRKVGDLRQFASVRRIVLDDRRGVAALAFSMAAASFWALADRSLDIGPLWWKGMPVGWQSMAGFRSPHLHHPEEDNGAATAHQLRILVTCGLDHFDSPFPVIPCTAGCRSRRARDGAWRGLESQ